MSETAPRGSVDPTVAAERARVRRLRRRRARRLVGAPAPVRRVRPRRLLRQLAGPARDARTPPPPGTASSRASSRARTGSGTTATSRWSTGRPSRPPPRGPADQPVPGPRGPGAGRLARPHPLMPRAATVATAARVPLGPASLAVLPRLAAALAGDAPVLPYAASTPPPDRAAARPGRPARRAGRRRRHVRARPAPPSAPCSPPRALRASSRATHERLGGPGQWLLALPAHHVAGLQVLLRSLDAGTTPVAMDLVRRLPPAGVRRRHRAARRPGAAATPAWCPPSCSGCSTTLAGPRRCAPSTRCSSAAPPCHRGCAAGPSGTACGSLATYGMSETAGGCVYDGKPLPCTEIAFDDGGPHPPRRAPRSPTATSAAPTSPPRRSASTRTGCAGSAPTTSGTPTSRPGCTSTAGSTTWSTPVASRWRPAWSRRPSLEHVPGVAEVVVVGSPDPEWGEAVCALVVLEPGAVRAGLTALELRAHLRGILPDHALPRRAVTADGRAHPWAGQARPACRGRPVQRGMMTACSATSRPCSASR